MPDVIVAVPILLAGLYLIGLAVVAAALPRRAEIFLSGFARSAFVHYLELSVRLVVGAALVSHAPQMRLPGLFAVLGWIVVGTTIVLSVVPWRWHRRFAEWSVPLATRNMVLFALGSLAAGVFVLVSLVPGPAAGESFWSYGIAGGLVALAICLLGFAALMLRQARGGREATRGAHDGPRSESDLIGPCDSIRNTPD